MKSISIHALLAESDLRSIFTGETEALFLSTLSLRRATFAILRAGYGRYISIHALLAESDGEKYHSRSTCSDFYPRSPCGERRCAAGMLPSSWSFLSTLSLRRATGGLQRYCPECGISIHALLAESDAVCRAAGRGNPYFYPRSPCGERLVRFHEALIFIPNFYPRSPCGERQ